VMGWQDDAAVRDLLRRCRALLFCGEEDFGMTPVEAQAAGRPVIAYRAGGALETVLDGQTGVFFDDQTVQGVTEGILRFESTTSLQTPTRIQEHARQFSTDRFRERFMGFYRWCIAHFQQGGPQQVRQAMAGLDQDAFL